MNPTTTTRPHDGAPHLRRRRRRRGTSLAAVAVASTLTLAGCAGEQTANDAAPASTVETVTVTATATDTPTSATPTPTTEPTPEPTQVQCSEETVPVSADAAGIAPPLPGESWTVWQTGNLCGTLGYAELATAGGTGSSPTQLLLYNEGRFLGTGIRCNALGQVTSSNAGSVTVQYRWPVGNDSNANMSGRAVVVFQWNGSSVDMIGSLPTEATGGNC